MKPLYYTNKTKTYVFWLKQRNELRGVYIIYTYIYRERKRGRERERKKGRKRERERE